MPNRISYLLSIGGWNVLLRTALMLMTAIGLSVVEFFNFGGIYCASITILLGFAGWIFRKTIMELGANYSLQTSRILPAYFAVFLVAKYSGLGHQMLLAIIAIGCMLMFNLNFWAITEAAIVDKENHGK